MVDVSDVRYYRAPIGSSIEDTREYEIVVASCYSFRLPAFPNDRFFSNCKQIKIEPPANCFTIVNCNVCLQGKYILMNERLKIVFNPYV